MPEENDTTWLRGPNRPALESRIEMIPRNALEAIAIEAIRSLIADADIAGWRTTSGGDSFGKQIAWIIASLGEGPDAAEPPHRYFESDRFDAGLVPPDRRWE